MFFMGKAYEKMRLIGFNERVSAFRLNADGSLSVFDYKTVIYPEKVCIKIKEIRETLTPGFLYLYQYLIYGVQRIKDVILYIVQIRS